MRAPGSSESRPFCAAEFPASSEDDTPSCPGGSVAGISSGAHQALNQPQGSVIADGGDGAGNFPVLSPEHGTARHRLLNRVEPRLDALEF